MSWLDILLIMGQITGTTWSSFKRRLEIQAPFGRIREIWTNDMALGPLGDQFVVVFEEDLQAEVAVEEEGQEDMP